jgi:hypothetical protein
LQTFGLLTKRRGSRHGLVLALRQPRSLIAAALELLAASPDDATEAILVAHGFTVEMPVDLIRAGLATAKAERVMVGSRSMQVTRVRNHRGGRRALTG